MLEWLKQIDESLFLVLNQAHDPFLDPIMIFLSAKKVWIPLYLIIIFYLGFTFRRKAIVIIIAILLAVGASDRVTSGIMKPGFQRLRPCHELHLKETIHLPGKCGGKYGLASSHAANTFALAMFLLFLLRKEAPVIACVMIIWAILVSYSRIYLGVHYPGDLIAGGLTGTLLAYLFYRLSLGANNKFFTAN